jgi:hypothetical protein
VGPVLSSSLVSGRFPNEQSAGIFPQEVSHSIDGLKIIHLINLESCSSWECFAKAQIWQKWLVNFRSHWKQLTGYSDPIFICQRAAHIRSVFNCQRVARSHKVINCQRVVYIHFLIDGGFSIYSFHLPENCPYHKVPIARMLPKARLHLPEDYTCHYTCYCTYYNPHSKYTYVFTNPRSKYTYVFTHSVRNRTRFKHKPTNCTSSCGLFLSCRGKKINGLIFLPCYLYIH